MGSQASPEICDIVMHFLEKRIISTDPNIIKWLRYRDDILLLYNGNQQELVNLLSRLNSTHEYFKFTMDSSLQMITYLDLNIFKGNRFLTSGILDTKVFSKPTETYQYLERNSAHPLATFKGFIKGEVLRYARLCNNSLRFSREERLLHREFTFEKLYLSRD